MNSGAQADEQGRTLPITVRVEAKPDPVRATGYVFSSDTSAQITETSIKKVGDKLFDVQFSIAPELIRDDSVATAMAYDDAGNVFYAAAVPVSVKATLNLMSSIPECPSAEASQRALLAGAGSLRQLVDFRTERIELLRLKLTRMMDDALVTKLQKFEEAFGLTRTDPLSSNLSTQELLDRLSRLQYALNRYNSHKSNQP